ncbi:MAG: ABC transporter substrate-binding protein [Dissulfurispiraceae bacterium]|jgi:phospholipid transport system substrate-binding protein
MPYAVRSTHNALRILFEVFILSVALACGGAYCSSAAAAQPQAAEVIKGFNAALLESMQKAKELGYSGRYKLLEPVIRESFAIPFMAAATVGSNWKTWNEKQKQTFLETYTEWTIASYAGQFNDYSGERFEIDSESKPSRGTVIVVSKLIQQDNDHVDFNYHLRNIDAQWRIVDIHILGVSQLALTRAQFVSVIKLKGFDALIAMLRKKTSNFSQRAEK